MSVIDTKVAGTVDFHNGEPQSHHQRLSHTAARGGAASHRYTSILPSPRYKTQCTSSTQHQQLPSPIPSPLESNKDSSDASLPPPPATIRVRPTSLHHNLLEGQGQATESILSNFPLPPTGPATVTANIFDGKMMPWLQEALQTVTMLESRLQELEEDCKAIPLYEQDRLEMIQVIQDLNAVVQQDQGWMDHAEMAIQWTTYVLENALISSSSSTSRTKKNNSSLRQSIRTRTRTHGRRLLSPGETNGDYDSVGRGVLVPGLERNTRSEGMLPTLVAERSTLGLLSSPSESGTGMGTGIKTERRLLESSNVDPSQPDPTTTSTRTTIVDNADNSRPSSTPSTTLSPSSLLTNLDDSSPSSDAVAAEESQERVYRSAIMVALRHLKTIDIAPSLSSVSSPRTSSGTKRPVSRRDGSSYKQEQEQEQREGANALKQGKRRTRTRMRTKGVPDRALKDWLDNSSMTSLVSNVITEELLEDELEEDEDEDPSIGRILATVEDKSTNNNNDRNRDTKEVDMQAKTPEMQSPTSSAQMHRRRHGSLSPLQEPDSATSAVHETISPQSDLLPISTNSSPETLAHTLNSAAATISGSSQSLHTNLSPAFIDERVYLKQHIQQLDRLRAQELNRHQRIEQAHRQLVTDLGRFSKELLGSVNELTCAQAALDEASELALLALSTFEKSTIGGIEVASSEQQQQQPVDASDQDSAISTSRTTTTYNNITATRQKRLIAASRKELESSGGLAGECIKRIRHLAADCVGITELAAQGHHNQQTSTTGINASFVRPMLNSVPNPATIIGNEGNGSAGGLQRHMFAAMVSPLEMKAIPTTVESFVNVTNATTAKELEPAFGTTTASASTVAGSSCAQGLQQEHQGFVHARSRTGVTESTVLYPPSTSTSQSMFVDGMALQEFEEHLASIRSSTSSNNSTVVSESTIFKRAFPSCSSARLFTNNAATVNNTKVSRRTSPATNYTAQSAFMKKVLTEDIYPCLLIHNAGQSSATTTVATKQTSRWMSAFLPSSTQFSTSLPLPSYGINGNITNSVQGQWVQRLLKAMEVNTCEIEAWKPTPSSTAGSGGGSMLVNRTTTAAPKTACCLCRTIRPCEFRLRLLDHPAPSLSSSTSSPLTSSSSTQPPQQQQYHALDRFCRERIVAVCDFFMFLAHLRQGLLDQPTSLELFRRALGLRQRMAYARIGSMDLLGGGVIGEASFSVTHE
ncbi:hypothetical protein BG015_009201 [Linnemannia schmuckeri]|uniref:Uncharacterized protein n=1 Tax=Linnemannia schmuckeri TaxID=64567 RepID=A0A9P5V9I8_9FUNG|nr:hypothetical protein BG015_009201 [Linnemannia schmuckeri]